MQKWAYRIFQSQGGSVALPTGAVPVVQLLNSAGQYGGELVTVVQAGNGVFEWVIKFPTTPPETL